jgi:hypothetical protein
MPILNSSKKLVFTSPSEKQFRLTAFDLRKTIRLPMGAGRTRVPVTGEKVFQGEESIPQALKRGHIL